VEVGGFRLEARIGAGGMGEVWRARHASGVIAAVKFDLHPPDDHRREAFFHEVRMVAGLDHPNCVLVLDTGQVSRSEARPEGPLRDGAPWLAMELARGGSLADPEHTPRSWDETRFVFGALLQGLAHAHARGVVHRDIKPGNLLLAGPRGLDVAPGRLLESRPVLSDFGVGVTVERAGLYDADSVGTPRYMAPEMIEARWRDFGPWTDLYQCGVLLWKLVTGGYPYRGNDTLSLYRGHLYGTPGAFSPAFDVPRGTEEYVRGLLAKATTERPAFAADALARLIALGDPVVGSGTGQVLADDDQAATVVRPVTGTAVTQRPSGEPAGLDLRLRGVGLGLWGLRPIPVVDRQEARDALWDNLALAQRTRRPGAVVLRGARGVGKSRLARWLVETAHELGLATGWRARHGDVPDGEAGVAGMLRRELRLGGLTRDEVEARLVALGLGTRPNEEELVASLLGWLVDDRPVAESVRHALAARVLESDRARIVWIDDADRGAESVEFARHALNRGNGPVLFVLVAADEGAEPQAVTSLVALARHPRSQVVDVGPLLAADHRALVRSLLGLDGALALEIEEKTAGNPRFAVELVNSWVEQGLLEPGSRGLRLRRGARPELPADLLTVARDRVEQFLHGRPTEHALLLEAAAFLGTEFDAEEWRAAGARAGLRLQPDLVAELLASRILRAEAPGRPLVFSQAIVREHLLARAQRQSRSERLALACAEALHGRPGVASERLARLWLAAGRLQEGARALMHAIDRRQLRGDHRTDQLLEQVTGVLTELRVPATDVRWGEVLLLRGAALHARGLRDEAEVLFVRAERDAVRCGWTAVEGVALRNIARLSAEVGDHSGALPLLTRAEGLLRSVGRDGTAADCRLAMGDAHARLGHGDAAEAMYLSTLTALDAPVHFAYAASPHLALAQLYQRRGDLVQAAAYARSAEDRARRWNLDQKLAQIANVAGEIARARGDLVEAERCYHEAARRYALYQDDAAHFPILNLGVVRVLLGRADEAHAMVWPLLQEFRRRGTEPTLAAYCCSVLLPTSAEDPELFDGCLTELSEFLTSSGEVDPDIARMCEIAADLQSDPGRRAAVRAIAKDQRRRLQRS
jgi:tetratricopeptide (TPR) repeat protein